MGTRSITRVFDENDKQIVNMYRQFDGYPMGHGKELHDFINDFAIVNGLGVTNPEGKIANGAGCFAAQMVKHFKEEPGGIYLVGGSPGDHGQDYEYQVIVHTPVVIIIVKGYKKKLFEGNIDEFRKFCEKDDE